MTIDGCPDEQLAAADICDRYADARPVGLPRVTPIGISYGVRLARRRGFGQASTMAGIAKLWKPVINVTDLDEGEQFWSEVSGLSPHGRHGQFSVLDADDPNERDSWILLQLVPGGQESVHSGTHLDFRVDDVARAARQIEAIGGTLVRPPDLYAPEGRELLEWAVMRDPFGNEFCIIRWPLD